jgi:hypothetical protein
MIKLFYHIYTSNHPTLGLLMIDNQIRRMKRTGFYDAAQLNCVITGLHCEQARELVELHGKFNILEVTEHDHEQWFEGRTLRYLWQQAEEGDQICYMHTKGISYISAQNKLNGFISPRNLRAINGWRHALEFYNIDEWRSRHETVGIACDTVGINLIFHPFYMYGGNFWWASGRHIRGLPNPIEWPGHDYERSGLSTDPNPELTLLRMRHEQWIFAKQDTGYYMSLFNILDLPKDDEHHLCKSFWLYEDDLVPHVIRDREKIYNRTDLLERMNYRILPPPT